MGSYEDAPPKDFWLHFPFNPLPDGIKQPLNVKNLENLLEQQSEFLTFCEINRAYKCIGNLTSGANSFQKTVLPPCSVKNSKPAFKFGEEVTDTIAGWIKKEFVAGPFDCPPVKNFRVNSILAVDQGEKIRPVLNVSLPEELSFNSNINDFQLESVKMSSARRFGFSVCEAGCNAKMSKFDLVDAYKNVPAKIFDLRLQGFSWLGKYFVECRQIFGARTAVANFDIFGNTLLTLTCAGQVFPKKFIHRALDDVPFVAPAHKDWCEKFSDRYVEICKSVGVSLAPNCPKFEKAFCNSTYGKVLGIFFDTKTLSWSLLADKKFKTLKCLKEIAESKTANLKQMQILMGRLNNICQMCQFMRIFLTPLYLVLKHLLSSPDAYCAIKSEVLNDVNIWIRFLTKKDDWLPICRMYYPPPLACKNFSSDAAGGTILPEEGCFLGCGNVGFDFSGRIVFAYQLFWPPGVLSWVTDSKGSCLGNKSTTLEMLGVILPFIVIPEQLVNQHVIVKVDNVACFFGWLNRHTSGDVMASILIRALHFVTAYLGCQVHFEHLPRKSTWDAHLVDRLSRSRTTTKNDKRLLSSFQFPAVPMVLWDWMCCPTEDWSLADRILNYVKYKCVLP